MVYTGEAYGGQAVELVITGTVNIDGTRGRGTYQTVVDGNPSSGNIDLTMNRECESWSGSITPAGGSRFPVDGTRDTARATPTPVPTRTLAPSLTPTPRPPCDWTGGYSGHSNAYSNWVQTGNRITGYMIYQGFPYPGGKHMEIDATIAGNNAWGTVRYHVFEGRWDTASLEIYLHPACNMWDGDWFLDARVPPYPIDGQRVSLTDASVQLTATVAAQTPVVPEPTQPASPTPMPSSTEAATSSATAVITATPTPLSTGTEAGPQIPRIGVTVTSPQTPERSTPTSPEPSEET